MGGFLLRRLHDACVKRQNCLRINPGSTLTTLSIQLKGRVVILDFWTYCYINCLRPAGAGT